MEHWYEKASVLYLKIRVALHQKDEPMTTTKTASSTNIDLKRQFRQRSTRIVVACLISEFFDGP